MPKKPAAPNLEIVSTEASTYLAAKIAAELNIPHRHTIRQHFSDGEHYYRIEMDNRNELIGKNVVIVGSTHTDDDLLEIYRVGSALAQYGAQRRIFVIPFFGYSTMERAVQAGEVVTAKANARLLSAIPTSGLGNTFMLLDLHAPGLLHYFEGECLSLELSAESLLIDAISKLKLKNFVMASADLGMPQAVQRLAEHFKTDIALVSKSRQFEDTTVLAAIGEVKGRNVVIYDDMTRSGQSLIKAAEAYRKQGATKVYGVLSHLAVTSSQVIAELNASSLEKIISTNSHPMSQHSEVTSSSKIILCDVAPIFAEAIRRS